MLSSSLDHLSFPLHEVGTPTVAPYSLNPLVNFVADNESTPKDTKHANREAPQSAKQQQIYLVPGLNAGNSFPDRLHDTACLVAQDRGKHTLGVLGGKKTGSREAGSTVRGSKQETRSQEGAESGTVRKSDSGGIPPRRYRRLRQRAYRHAPLGKGSCREKSACIVARACDYPRGYPY